MTWNAEALRVEWPSATLDPQADLAAWREGVALYERDDYPSMMRCADVLARSLAHNLYGPGILFGGDLPETVFKVLYASVVAPPDGQTFAASAQRAARIALWVTRQNGWQPTSMGGSGQLPHLFEDRGNQMLYSAALAPPGQPVGNLWDFFACGPEAPVGIPEERSAEDRLDSVRDVLDAAEAGDEVQQLMVASVVAHVEGDLERALALLTIAAGKGHVDAMVQAGKVADELGRPDESLGWARRAAESGSPTGMFNLGIAYLQRHDLEAADVWLQRAAEAGEAEAYAALIEIAERRGDQDAAERWATAGAIADNPRCLQMKANYLLRADPDAVDAYLPVLERAAELGNTDAMVQAGIVHHHLGQDSVAGAWLRRARDAGNPNGGQKLAEYGLS